MAKTLPGDPAVRDARISQNMERINKLAKRYPKGIPAKVLPASLRTTAERLLGEVTEDATDEAFAAGLLRISEWYPRDFAEVLTPMKRLSATQRLEFADTLQVPTRKHRGEADEA